jgi:hypothetical protein
MADRLDVIAGFATAMQARQRTMGRTALMKFAYFLQELKGVGLGYRFSIYTYGPYDAQVLEDLKVAQLKGKVATQTVRYATGTGQEIKPAPQMGDATATAVEPEVQAAIESIVDEFGGKSAVGLEMASTILFVARAKSRDGAPSAEDVAAEVKVLKPRLALAAIMEETRRMAGHGHIELAA